MQARPLSSPAARNLNHSGPSSIAEGPGLAHDAGNLLEALVLYSDLLGLPGVLQPKHQHYARELKLLAHRSGDLINRLLKDRPGADLPEQDRPEQDHPPRALGLVPPRAPKRLLPGTVMQAFAPLLRSMAAPEVTLTVAVAPHLPQLPFAAEVLERILANLTRNAVTALHSHRPRNAAGETVAGHIHIGICGDATRLSLTVMDNGPGMPPEVVAAFLRPTPLPRQALAGIGHHVVHELVRSSGGRLSITVLPERETTLRIDWPVFEPADSASADPSQVASQISGRVSTRANRKGTPLSC
jgi:signal transduction histidine kinase